MLESYPHFELESLYVFIYNIDMKNKAYVDKFGLDESEIDYVPLGWTWKQKLGVALIVIISLYLAGSYDRWYLEHIEGADFSEAVSAR